MVGRLHGAALTDEKMTNRGKGRDESCVKCEGARSEQAVLTEPLANGYALKAASCLFCEPILYMGSRVEAKIHLVNAKS